MRLITSQRRTQLLKDRPSYQDPNPLPKKSADAIDSARLDTLGSTYVLPRHSNDLSARPCCIWMPDTLLDARTVRRCASWQSEQWQRITEDRGCFSPQDEMKHSRFGSFQRW